MRKQTADPTLSTLLDYVMQDEGRHVNSQTTKHFNSFLFGENSMPRLVRLGLISDRIAPKYREIGLLT